MKEENPGIEFSGRFESLDSEGQGPRSMAVNQVNTLIFAYFENRNHAKHRLIVFILITRHEGSQILLDL